MKLDIIHHNVRHWDNGKNILANYYLKHNPDVISINSHGLNPANGEFVKLFSYSNKTSGTGKHSGAAILTKSYIPHTNHRVDMDPNSLYTIINTNMGKIVIFTFYRPCRMQMLPLIDIQKVLDLNLPTLIVTDANVHHIAFGHSYSDRLGKLLFNFMRRKDLYFLGPNFKTYFNSVNKGKPDIILGNKDILKFAVHITEGDRLCASDHLPIHIQLNTSPIAIPANESRLNLNRANWEGFRMELEEIPLPITQNMSIQELESNTKYLMNKISSAISNNIPIQDKIIIPAFQPSTKTKKLQLIYNQRHHLYKDSMDNRKSLILIKIKSQIDISMRADYDSYWQNQTKVLDDLKVPKPKEFFKKIKFFKGTGPNDRGSYLNHNGKTISEPKEMAQTYADVWNDIFSPHNPNQYNRQAMENINRINTWIDNNQNLINVYERVDLNKLSKDHILTHPISISAVKQQINKIKSPASGISGQCGAVLRELPEKTYIHIARIFNAMLASGYFPEVLKKGKTYMIPKPGKDLSIPTNHRPITLLEPIAKTFEKILNKRIRTHLENTRQLNDNQYGFRSERSIQDIIFYSTAYIDKHYSINNSKVSVTCLDIEKAFDRVWWNGLIYKIHNNLDLPLISKKILSNYLVNRTYQFTAKNAFSTPISPRAGVPQGSAISPTLFSIFVNDIPEPKNNPSIFLSYADDITILTKSNTYTNLIKRTNEELRRIISWQEEWRIVSSLPKSSTMIIGKTSHASRALGPIRHNNKYIPYQDECKILGVTFDHKLKFQKDIKKKITLAKIAQNKLRRFIFLHPKIQLQLFKLYVLPIITFCNIPLLYSGEGLKQVQILQNKCIRFIHNIDWREFITNKKLHEDLGIDSTTKSINRTYEKLFIKLQARNQEIFNSTVPGTKLEYFYNHPADMIY